MNQISIKDLLNNVKTDVSGKWVSITDIEDYTRRIIDECARVADQSSSYPYKNYSELIKQHFGLL